MDRVILEVVIAVVSLVLIAVSAGSDDEGWVLVGLASLSFASLLLTDRFFGLLS